MHAKVSPFPEAVDGGRESTRPIRALNRGLEVLIELNRLERAAINTLAAAVQPAAHHHLPNFGNAAPRGICRSRPA